MVTGPQHCVGGEGDRDPISFGRKADNRVGDAGVLVAAAIGILLEIEEDLRPCRIVRFAEPASDVVRQASRMAMNRRC